MIEHCPLFNSPVAFLHYVDVRVLQVRVKVSSPLILDP